MRNGLDVELLTFCLRWGFEILLNQQNRKIEGDRSSIHVSAVFKRAPPSSFINPTCEL